MDYRIFNVHIDVNACDCTRGCTDTCERVCTESWLWEKNPLLHRGIKPATVVWWSDGLSNWDAFPTLETSSWLWFWKHCWAGVASRLQNCGNPAEYIYWSHNWKVSVPVCPQKMRMGHFFFFFFFFSVITRHYLCDFFYDWSAAHSSTKHCNCIRKGRHLSSLAWMGIEPQQT